MKRKWMGSLMIVIILSIGGWVFINSPFYDNGEYGTTPQNGVSLLKVGAQEVGDRPVKTFELTAEETEWTIEDGKQVNAWTYNGTVPGEALRVTEGDFVRVHLENELDVPVTIHWHGMILPNKMDGVPGLTQDAVEPGESFTYEFIANDPGTYWYHSHQHSAVQVDRGLYGSLVIEEKEPTYERDEFFILDEWATGSTNENSMNMGGMMQGHMSSDGEIDTKQIYDTFTVNGKAGGAVEPLTMQKGETARLRFVNAGYQQHQLTFPEGSIEVIANDAEEVQGEKGVTNVIEIAPGERIDVAYTKQGEELEVIAENPDVEHAEDMVIPVVSNEEEAVPSDVAVSPRIDMADGTSYGSEELLFEKTPDADVTYDMDLSMGMSMGEGMSFQINDKAFPKTPPIQVEEGDIVQVNIKNSGMMNHPMHLHGHRFQVDRRNGKPYKNPIVKDLIHVKPGEEYVVYFEANNKGEWLFHCHDNNHADLGMVTIVDYKGVYSPFNVDGKNKPA